YIIQWYDYLNERLDEDGTWYGDDRLMAIQLLGTSACLDELYHSEEAYNLWVDCLAAQPAPHPDNVELILRPRHVPLRLRDNGAVLWPRDPEACRARLRGHAAEKLAELRSLEARLRVEQENPERAAAVELALAKADKDDQALVREIRSHER